VKQVSFEVWRASSKDVITEHCAQKFPDVSYQKPEKVFSIKVNK